MKYINIILINLLQKNGLKYKIFKFIKIILINLKIKFKINPLLILEIALKNLIINIKIKNFYFNNIKFSIPILISYFKAYILAIKFLIIKNYKNKSLIYNITINIINSFNKEGFCILNKFKYIKKILTYRIYIIYLLLNRNKILKKKQKNNFINKNIFYFKKLIHLNKP